jgi:peptide/nickel transport system ATP-binding protein
MLLDAVPSLDPPEAIRRRAGEAPVLAVRGLCKTYISRNWFGRRREVDAARRRRHHRAARRDRRHRRRVRLRQVDRRALHRAADRSDAGEIEILGKPMHGQSMATLKPLRKKVQIVFQDPYRSLNPGRRSAMRSSRAR